MYNNIINQIINSDDKITPTLLNRLTLFMYSIEQFGKPIHTVENLTSVLDRDITDGIYQCQYPNKLDLYCENFSSINDAKAPVIIVGLTAAVGNRTSKVGPFFSGVGLNKILKLPLISIADPLVSSTNIGLAWYTGYEQQNFQKELAHFLDTLSFKYSARLIIFGASGAGFAALALATFLRCSASLIVLNPQTSISKYFFDFVRDYIAHAYPTHSVVLNSLKNIQRSTQVKEIFDLLEQGNTVHDVTNMVVADNIQLLYLQNKTDSHMLNHALPFLANRNLQIIGKNALFLNNVGFYAGSWGKGHIVPNKNIILALLKKLVNQNSLDSILVDLENGLDGENPNAGELTFLNKNQYKISLKVTQNGNTICAQCHMKYRGIILEGSEIQYAFYLMSGAIRLKTAYYQKKQLHTFSLPEGYSRLSVRCFARDSFGNIISTKSKEFDINI